MTSETDAEFLDRLEELPRYVPAYRTLDSDRLFALARRGAAVAHTDDKRAHSPFANSENAIEVARAALEERT